jgi:hypothetical protein
MLSNRPAKMVAPQFLSNVKTVIYTPAADVKYAIIREIALNNIDALAHTFTIAIGDPATTSNILFDAIPIQAVGSEPPTYSRACVLLPGDTIQALADVANKVSISISGIEYT